MFISYCQFHTMDWMLQMGRKLVRLDHHSNLPALNISDAQVFIKWMNISSISTYIKLNLGIFIISAGIKYHGILEVSFWGLILLPNILATSCENE